MPGLRTTRRLALGGRHSFASNLTHLGHLAKRSAAAASGRGVVYPQAQAAVTAAATPAAAAAAAVGLHCVYQQLL